MPNPTTSSMLCRALLCGVTLAAGLAAQRLPRRAIPRPIDFATSQNDNLFSILRSQEDIHELETALADLEEGRPEDAVSRLHELLRVDARGVVPVAPGRFLGLRNATVTVLANMSEAGRAAHEQLVRREAGNLLERPLTALSPDQLESLAERFPTSDAGRTALQILGDRALERGDGLSAAEYFRAALDASAIGSSGERRAAERLACAEVLVEPVRAAVQSAHGRLHAAGDDVLEVVAKAEDRCPSVGGGGSGAEPMSEPVGAPQPWWRQEVWAPGFDVKEKGQLAMHATGDLDGVYVCTGRELIAFDPLRRRIQWVTPAPLRVGEQERSGGGYSETINQDMVLAAACSADVVVAALQVPDNSSNVDYQSSFRIMSKIPKRRLFAFSRRTGDVLWKHYDELDGPLTRRYRGHDAAGPPLIAGDTLYVPIQDRTGAIAFSVAAYDLHTGKPKWRRLVCSSQQDVNMFGNARMEFASSPLALDAGVIYGASNLGVVYALDAASGRVRWVSAYGVVRMPRAMLHDQADRQVFFANNAPVVVDGVACFTPLDSQYVLGIDVDDGSQLWQVLFDARVAGTENRVQWLCGAIDGKFVLSGAGVVAVQARPEALLGGQAQLEQLVRPEELGVHRRAGLPARPAITTEHLWVPTRDRMLAFDHRGNRVAEREPIELQSYQPGNLAFVDGVGVSLRQRRMDLVLDAGALLQRSARRVERTPDDPHALLRLAGLRRALLTDASSLDERREVKELFRRGLEACKRRGLPESHPTRVALQRELYDQALAVAEAAAQAGSDDALSLLGKARDLAPTTAAWIEVQTMLLSRCRDDRARFLTELQRLEQRAPSADMPPPLELPVTAFVLWQRALAHEDEPKAAVALWQSLLEQHGAEAIGAETAGDIAEDHIGRLVDLHGEAVYADIAARADAALTAAGDRDEALEAITRRFPNSDAARRAGIRLLDRAVELGDLAVACNVLARAIRTDSVAPGVLRRVQVAAQKRGNHALAAAMVEALAAHEDAPSDWREDGGNSFAAAARAAFEPAPPSELPTLAVPSDDLRLIPPRARREYLQPLPTHVVDGFPQPQDVPLYAIAPRDLLAFDLAGGERPMFAEPVYYVEHLLLCGTTLIVPDQERVFAIDYRTGEPRWTLDLDAPRVIESLGVTAGVLHVCLQPRVLDGDSEWIGIEPITGTRLFTRSLSDAQLKPKPIGDQLLLLELGDALRVHRVDPVTGRFTASIPCGAATGPGKLQLSADSLATPLYPQSVSGDAERVFLPVASHDHDAAAEPQVFALDDDGGLAWSWRGTAGMHLSVAQRRGEHFVILETSNQRASRLLVLDARTGDVRTEVDVGFAAMPLNWKRSRLDNAVPRVLTIESAVDPKARDRQLVCLQVDELRAFAVPLRGLGQIEREPQVGAEFVTFGVRSPRGDSGFQLFAIDLESHKGAFSGDRRFRTVPTRGAPGGMTAVGAYTVVSTTQGLLLLGPPPDERR